MQHLSGEFPTTEKKRVRSNVRKRKGELDDTARQSNAEIIRDGVLKGAEYTCVA